MDNDHSMKIGLVIDHGCTEEWIQKHIDTKRLSLPLDTKRPTVARRFFCDHSPERTIVTEMEHIVRKALVQSNLVQQEQQHDDQDYQVNSSNVILYCNPYLRILEYLEEGRSLAPHTDGHKVCESTGLQSTHTLLLFLTNVHEGGETVLMNSNAIQGWTKHQEVVVPPDRIFKRKQHKNTMRTEHYYTSIALDQISEDSVAVALGVSPRRGRILLFPHEWPHAGAVCRSIPKIMLRAELTLHLTSSR